MPSPILSTSCPSWLYPTHLIDIDIIIFVINVVGHRHHHQHHQLLLALPHCHRFPPHSPYHHFGKVWLTHRRRNCHFFTHSRWILIFPTSRLPPWWAICRWGILISRYINIAHLGYNTIFLSCMPLSCIQNSPNSIFDLVLHFWDQLNTFKKLTNSANSQLSSWIQTNIFSSLCSSW